MEFLVAVLGVEQIRNVPGDQAAANSGGRAMWNGHKCVGMQYPLATYVQFVMR